MLIFKEELLRRLKNDETLKADPNVIKLINNLLNRNCEPVDEINTTTAAKLKELVLAMNIYTEDNNKKRKKKTRKRVATCLGNLLG
jgi:hypothetical protein